MQGLLILEGLWLRWVVRIFGYTSRKRLWESRFEL